MRWYVSRNGTTIGPIDEPSIAQMIQSEPNMRAATVKDEHGSAWMPIAQSPFAPLLPPTARESGPVGATVALFALCLGVHVLVGIVYAISFGVVFGVVALFCFRHPTPRP